MQTITSVDELKIAISILETEQKIKEQLLKEQLYMTYQSLKPANLIKNAFKEVISSPFLVDNMLGTVTGLATGYLSKKIVVGTSVNLLRKLFGSMLGFGVTNLVSQNPDIIKALGSYILRQILHKKTVNPKET